MAYLLIIGFGCGIIAISATLGLLIHELIWGLQE